MRSFDVSSHAIMRMKERCPIKGNRYKIGLCAWEEGRNLDAAETKMFLLKWANSGHKCFPEVRFYRGFFFVFEEKNNGHVVLITMYPKQNKL